MVEVGELPRRVPGTRLHIGFETRAVAAGNRLQLGQDVRRGRFHGRDPVEILAVEELDRRQLRHRQVDRVRGHEPAFPGDDVQALLEPLDVAPVFLRPQAAGACLEERAELALVGDRCGARIGDGGLQLGRAPGIRRQHLEPGAPAQRRLALAPGGFQQSRLFEQGAPRLCIVPDGVVQGFDRAVRAAFGDMDACHQGMRHGQAGVQRKHFRQDATRSVDVTERQMALRQPRHGLRLRRGQREQLLPVPRRLRGIAGRGGLVRFAGQRADPLGLRVRGKRRHAAMIRRTAPGAPPPGQ